MHDHKESPHEDPAGDAAPEAFLARALQQTQENLRRAGPAATAGYTLVGAILMLGGGGYVADKRFGTSPWLLLTGLVLGIAVGFVELAKIVWRK
ncbi:MAG: AtpZ/AtpI family protein [Acidobacteriota bacterium]|nr:AtpZ/AtpI family protein [Acidobacteriota bacterium]